MVLGSPARTVLTVSMSASSWRSSATALGVAKVVRISVTPETREVCPGPPRGPRWVMGFPAPTAAESWSRSAPSRRGTPVDAVAAPERDHSDLSGDAVLEHGAGQDEARRHDSGERIRQTQAGCWPARGSPGAKRIARNAERASRHRAARRGLTSRKTARLQLNDAARRAHHPCGTMITVVRHRAVA